MNVLTGSVHRWISELDYIREQHNSGLTSCREDITTATYLLTLPFALISFVASTIHASLLVGWLLRSFVALIVISLKRYTSPIVIKVGTDVRHQSVPGFSFNFREFGVKVQGQNCRTENLQIVIAHRPCFKISSWNVAVLPLPPTRSNLSMKCDCRQNSRWRLAEVVLSKWFLVFSFFIANFLSRSID